MMKFSSFLLLGLVLMLTITSSQTTITTNKNTITSTTTTFTPISVVAAESTISTENVCIELLTKFAVCLPYISSNPNNNLTSEEVPPGYCCDLYISYGLEGSSLCLCHVIKEPSILGDPVNMTMIYDLSSVCPFFIPPYHVALNVMCKAIAPNLPHLGSILAPPVG
ncbi:uncharacterized protein LOC113326264 [Papaver somniferum]|uniref:uncharacterized protein LOC113326264 n=1 Tax=Papaver somniferum TaxID=3469 RepID=UPI000E704B3A|nr:uncharacterized protein LOC113326264 [Papaver somniferum]